jgi:Uma2 family endonuclease
MSTIERAPAEPTSAPSNEEPRVLLHGVSWEEYESIGEALRDRPNLRLTYDDGALEIMTTSHRHEVLKKWMGGAIEALVEECGLSLAVGGSMTFKKVRRRRGLEPDECYWIANERVMRGRTDYDPEVHPPPDLALEVEVSRSAINRMALYATLGVPEVWRYDGERLRVFALGEDGAYHLRTGSAFFPGVPVEELPAFANPDQTKDYLSKLREFRTWVRQQLEEKRGE